MGRKIVKKYFNENALHWVKEGYEEHGFNFPMGYHRTRIALNVISKLGRATKIADLGCGAGQLSMALARMGYESVGIDQCKEMIEMANTAAKVLPQNLRDKVSFLCEPLEKNKLEPESFGAVTAMGIIYHFSDDKFFSIAKKLLKKDGLFLVSCRNRLFNMVSITHRTQREIRSGEAFRLIDEIERLYQPVPRKDAKRLEDLFMKSAAELKNLSKKKKDAVKYLLSKEGTKTTFDVEWRQHTPAELTACAKRNGFEEVGYYGVHPHIMMPKMNELLPPRIYNAMSSFLEAIEHLPMSLIWSSQFIGIFRKIDA